MNSLGSGLWAAYIHTYVGLSPRTAVDYTSLFQRSNTPKTDNQQERKSSVPHPAARNPPRIHPSLVRPRLRTGASASPIWPDADTPTSPSAVDQRNAGLIGRPLTNGRKGDQGAAYVHTYCVHTYVLSRQIGTRSGWGARLNLLWYRGICVDGDEEAEPTAPCVLVPRCGQGWRRLGRVAFVKSRRLD